MDAKNQILFLCTGNYYRSRYAEELFNFRARRDGLAWSAFSRRLAEKGSPDNVGPMSPFVLQALSAKSIEPEGAGRLPVSCSAADFAAAELVIALKDGEHRPFVERRFPDMLPRIIFWDVDDVAFVPPAVALAQIDGLIDDLVSGLRGACDSVRESAAAILLDEDGRLLMQLRDNFPDIREPGKIGLFGGRREGDESFLECIVREIQEELGYYLPPERFEHLARWSGPDYAASEGAIHAELFLARGVPVAKLTIAEGSLKIVAVDELEQVRPLMSLPTRYALDTFLPRIRSHR